MDKESILNLLESSLAECLLIIIRQTEPVSYRWVSTNSARAEIGNKTNQSPPTINRNIKKLIDKEILIKQGRGIYTLNKKYITLEFYSNSNSNSNSK